MPTWLVVIEVAKRLNTCSISRLFFRFEMRMLSNGDREMQDVRGVDYSRLPFSNMLGYMHVIFCISPKASTGCRLQLGTHMHALCSVSGLFQVLQAVHHLHVFN